MVTQTTFGPVGLCLFHSVIKELPRTLLDRSGRINLIPASKATKTTSGLVGLYISHPGVKCHPNHFQAGIRTHTSLNAQRFITLTIQTCDVPVWANVMRSTMPGQI
jgi:hypothetical protein